MYRLNFKELHAFNVSNQIARPSDGQDWIVRTDFRNLLIMIIFTIICCSCNHAPNPDQPSIYAYKKSIEELKITESEAHMIKAGEIVDKMEEVNANGKYKGTLESIDEHPVPDWYRDAKLCIFYDWGPYSIAGYGEKNWNRARYPDWYLNRMYHEYADYHQETWGPDFHRDDFLGMFDAENFNADEIVDMVKMSGARYIVPFNKHHDGFCLWNSSFTHRDVVDMKPGRDLTAELMEACRKEGIYTGFYFSVEEYEYPVLDDDRNLQVRYWNKNMALNEEAVREENGEYYGDFLPKLHNRMISGKIPVHNFINDLILPQALEFIDLYDPDILWFDGEWTRPSEYYRTPEIVAYFYNKAEGRKEVASNDRLGEGTREKHGDFYTSETDEVVQKMDEPWEENRSMSESYGYNHLDSLENYLTADELIGMLVRIVAKGGNLNLMVNPDGTGKVPEIQLNLLRELGDWLKVNGEAIYGTRPYEKLCDNTQLGQPVWYTMSKDSTWAYAIVLDWPKSETFICPGVNLVWDSEVHMLGYDKPLEWVDVGRSLWGLSAKIPDEMLGNPAARPCNHAWVLKFRYDKNNEFGK